jgi:NAD-dependent dihydropyrimidine dehydrogenase PreA subunit
MIFYFSGTGNSLNVARGIAREQGERLIPVCRALQKEEFEYALHPGELVGFVFPAHAWSPPKAVTDLVARLQLKNFLNNTIFAVCTCGGDPGAALRRLERALRRRLWRLDAGFSVNMPDNYLPLFDADPPEAVQRKLKEADEAVRRINTVLKTRPTGVVEDPAGRFPRLKTAVAGRLFRTFAMSDRPFYATERCTSCGKCVKMCPVDNISLKNGKPKWNGHCTQCMACIQRCPQKAIQYGKRTAARGRYVHPELNKERQKEI